MKSASMEMSCIPIELVTWSLEGKRDGISVDNKSGLVKVTKNVPAGTGFTVKAMATGGSGVTAQKTITVQKKATIAIKVIRPVDSIEITGQRYVSAGSSAKFTAKVLQENAGSKKVVPISKVCAIFITISFRLGRKPKCRLKQIFHAHTESSEKQAGRDYS